MTTLTKCIKQVRASIKASIKDGDDVASIASKDVDDVLEKFEKGELTDEVLVESLREITKKTEILAKIKKRQAMLNSVATSSIYRFINEHWPNDPQRGFDSLIVGSQSVAKGSRDSVERRMDGLNRKYLGAFQEDLEKRPELRELMMKSDPETDLQITRAMFSLGRGIDTSSIHPDIVELAKVMRKYQEVARLDANNAGAYVGKIDDYVVAQSHDPSLLVRGRKGSDARTEGEIKSDWVEYIKARLDHKQTFGNADPDKFLSKVYDNLITGDHQASSSKSGPRIALTGFKNIGRSASSERVLHFKDADAWYEYNDAFGAKTMRQAYTAGLMKSANDTAMMRAFGPNARMNLEKAAKMYKDHLTKLDQTKYATQIKSLANGFDPQKGRFTKMLDIVDGTANSINPSRAGTIAAHAGAMYRATVLMSKLGGMIFSMVSDTALFASAAKNRSDRGWFNGMGRSVGGLIESIGGTPAEKRRSAQRLGVFHDAMIQSVGARFGADRDLSGFLQNSVNTFMKFNLAAWWTDAMRMGAVTMFANDVGDAAGKSFAEMGNLARALKKSGIDDAEWQAISKSQLEDFNGNRVLYPERIAELDDEVIGKYIKSQNRKVNDRNIRLAKEELETKLRGYYVDSAESAVLNPDAKTNFYMQKHHQRGTVEGEIARHVGLLKSFGVAIVQKSIGEEVFGKGYVYDPTRGVGSNFIKALKDGENGELAGVMSLVAGMSVMGYASLTLKDVARGKDPIMPWDDEFDGKIMARSALQGGGLGILGDWLIGETMNDRYGHNPLASGIGPLGGTVQDMYDIVGAITRGEFDKLPDEVLKTVVSHTPYQNHPVARAVVDYAILQSLTEAANPGYMDRMEQRHTANTGQGYWSAPSKRSTLIGDLSK